MIDDAGPRRALDESRPAAALRGVFAALAIMAPVVALASALVLR